MSKRERNQHKVDENRRESQNIVASDPPQHNEIAARAYELWVQRGCPDGSPQDDWCQAEEELRRSSAPRVRTAGGDS